MVYDRSRSVAHYTGSRDFRKTAAISATPVQHLSHKERYTVFDRRPLPCYTSHCYVPV